METGQSKRDYAVILVITVGAVLRLTLAFFNAPNNTYDDYLEPIAYFINNNHRPFPGRCWECYQPPLFYYITSGIYKLSFSLTHNYFYSWKTIQLVNSIFSCGTLLVTYGIIRCSSIRHSNIVPLVLAIAAIYPRDIYTSATISNDSLLTFIVTLSIFLFSKYWNSFSMFTLACLCLSVVAASFTKQHGLITLSFLCAIALSHLYHNRKNLYKSLLTAPVVLPFLTLIICLGDELWKFTVTNHFLVSNQHFFSYAKSQPPGSLDKISFSTFHLFDLVNNPFLGKVTVGSYWTVLFAGSWFDYEWRFTSPKLPQVQFISTSLYILGFLVLLLFIVGSISLIKRSRKISYHNLLLGFVGICFFLVPLLQTVRFPYFSSMKGLFFLPASSIICLALGYCLSEIKWLVGAKIRYFLTAIILLVGIFHVSYVVYYLSISLPILSGPLWQYPRIIIP
ncbi:hypothetical protein [Desertivirga arenae]|uniref:hypothetical protein n=1 Tax=Desertivirga arenae TaxID=2810309 RepID=UPI001A959BBF|nr:hypothetical protein [Pedobacter sp. SYSU D00823]